MSPTDSSGAGTQRSVARWARPALWLAYVVVVLEILFMISPFALYFYSVYGPGLNLLHRSPWTAWMTGFFLPHFSATSSPILDALKPLAEGLVLLGLVLFLIGFAHIYGSKLLGRGAVTGGLYARVRHPQYTALAVLGLGTLLIWPRFTVLLMYLVMLALYGWLARHEEAVCSERFGADYERYLERSGRFLPRLTAVPAAPSRQIEGRAVTLGWLLFASLTLVGALGLRDCSLSKVSVLFEEEVAILSPARLDREELRRAYDIAGGDPELENRLKSNPGEALLVYVLPEEWYLADLPAERYLPGREGHVTPADFDRNRLKLLYTRPRTHYPQSRGHDIVRKAYGREPVALVHIDVAGGAVTAVETPPPHVLWGDIPTPMW